jgi:hypothetical protein
MILAPVEPEAGCRDDIGEGVTAPPSGEQVAIHYIDEQVTKARQSLRRTRTFCLVTVLVILGYMCVVTTAIRNQLLRPQAAAEVAACYFSKFAAQNGPALSAGLEGQSPKPTATKSDGYNSTIKSGSPRVESEVATYVQGFLSHHGNVQKLFLEAQHPKTAQELSAELDQEIRERLPSQDGNRYPNPDYMSYLNEKLETLSQLELQLNRLAQDRDLTPYEKALRHVIASTMGNIRGSS